MNGNNTVEHLRNEVLSRQQYAQLQAAFDSLNQNKQAEDETPPQEGEDVCVVCWDRRADRALLPCGHLCLCSRCSSPATFRGNLRGRCPACQCTVLGPMRVFRSGVPTPGDGSNVAAPTRPTADDGRSGTSASLMRAALIAISESITLRPIDFLHCTVLPLCTILLCGVLVVLTESYLASTTDIAVLWRWLLSILMVIIALVIVDSTTFIDIAIKNILDSRCKTSNATKNVVEVITAVIGAVLAYVVFSRALDLLVLSVS